MRHRLTVRDVHIYNHKRPYRKYDDNHEKPRSAVRMFGILDLVFDMDYDLLEDVIFPRVSL